MAITQVKVQVNDYTAVVAIGQIWHSCNAKHVPQVRVLYVTTVPYLVYVRKQQSNTYLQHDVR